jgi:diguanylate cyclase (GGDEF)-like protein
MVSVQTVTTAPHNLSQDPVERRSVLLLMALALVAGFGALLLQGLTPTGALERGTMVTLLAFELGLFGLQLVRPQHRRTVETLLFTLPAALMVGSYVALALSGVGSAVYGPLLMLALLPWALFVHAYAYLVFGRRTGLILSAGLLIPTAAVALISGRSDLFTPVTIGGLAVITFYIFAAAIERQAAHGVQRDAHSLHDPLTGLPNRIALQRALQSELEAAERSHGNLAIFFIDVDRFRAINDTLGHAIGDDMLRHVASRLEGSTREEDMVARLSGDEFVVMCRGCGDRDTAEQIAGKLLRIFAQPFQLSQRNLTITASVGVSLMPEHGRDASELLSKADSAKAQAKATGKNRYQLFSSEIEGGTLGRSKMERSLRNAFEADALTLSFQPILDLERNSVGSFEALLRWNDAELGVVSPAEFIPVAEGSGLIGPIGTWALRRSLHALKRWHEMTRLPLRMAVNISSHQLSQSDFVDMVTSILDEVQLQPKYLELEVTESIVLEPSAIERLSRLRSLGVNVLIDDFGTGYSSLAYLQKLPMDGLKIDRSFISDLSIDRNSYGNTLVETIIRLARTLGRHVVAEGVETAEQLEILREMGCSRVQGYHLSRPLGLEETEMMLMGRTTLSDTLFPIEPQLRHTLS